MSEDIDYGEILEALNEKADRDLQNVTTNINNTFVKVDGSNFNADGKSVLSGMGMPSDTYVDLTLGASGDTYTAPANGFYFIQKASGGTNLAMVITNNTTGFAVGDVYAPSAQYRKWIPVRKGDVIEITYTFTGATTAFRFFYAEGEV